MPYDPVRHHRQSIRLPGYDYTQRGGYFLTIVARERECLFGDIVNGEMVLNELGEIVQACWEEIPDHFAHVELDAFVVMPNHLHGIILITNAPNPGVGARHAVPLQPTAERFGQPVPGSIPTIVRSFKSAATKRINDHRRGTACRAPTPGAPIWQRSYYEHVIRSERELERIRAYIQANPAQWAEDAENPQRGGAR